MTPLLQVNHLKKYFPTNKGVVHAVDDVSFFLNAGKTMGVVGESGCGKSTLGRTIIHLQSSTDGQILFEGKDVTHVKGKELDRLRMQMQIVFQDPYSSLNPRLSVHDTIIEPLKLSKRFKGAELEQEARRLMDLVGIESRLYNAYPHEMDGGRRQRVGVARALALQPKFIVCDEPVSALDVSIQAQILNLLMDLQDSMGLTYLFITHDLSVVKHISDEIAVLYLGRCVEKAPSRELFANPLHPYTKALLSAIPIPDISAHNKQMEIIRGEVPSPVNPPAGCRFAGRCPHCKEDCTGADPEFRNVGNDHYVACPYAEALA